VLVGVLYSVTDISLWYVAAIRPEGEPHRTLGGQDQLPALPLAAHTRLLPVELDVVITDQPVAHPASLGRPNSHSLDAVLDGTGRWVPSDAGVQAGVGHVLPVGKVDGCDVARIRVIILSTTGRSL